FCLASSPYQISTTPSSLVIVTSTLRSASIRQKPDSVSSGRTLFPSLSRTQVWERYSRKSRPSCVKEASWPKLHFSEPGKSCTPAPAQSPSRKTRGTRSLWRSDGISIMTSAVPRWGSALALVQLLHAQSGEGEDADADQDQQGFEEDLHGCSLSDARVRVLRA